MGELQSFIACVSCLAPKRLHIFQIYVLFTNNLIFVYGKFLFASIIFFHHNSLNGSYNSKKLIFESFLHFIEYNFSFIVVFLHQIEKIVWRESFCWKWILCQLTKINDFCLVFLAFNVYKGYILWLEVWVAVAFWTQQKHKL